jgi:hypothetical protein
VHHERRAKYLGLARNQTMISCRVRTYSSPYTNYAVVTRMQVCAIKKLLHASIPAMSFYHFLFLNTEEKLGRLITVGTIYCGLLGMVALTFVML